MGHMYARLLDPRFRGNDGEWVTCSLQRTAAGYERFHEFS